MQSVTKATEKGMVLDIAPRIPVRIALYNLGSGSWMALAISGV